MANLPTRTTANTAAEHVGDHNNLHAFHNLIDAAGDLIVGTGVDTAGRLAKGSALQGLRVNAAGTALEYGADAASSVVFTPAAGIAATNVQAAIEEVVSDSSAAYAPKAGGVEFVSPAQMSAIQGSPTLSGSGGPRFSAWLLDAATSETVVGNVWVPDWFTTFRVDLYWTNAGAGAGNVAWNADYSPTFDGDDQAAGDVSLGLTPLTAPAAGVTKVSTLFASVTRSNNLYHFRITRGGADASDTLANDAALNGLAIVRLT